VSHVLSCYGWPNNVRELEQALRRAYSFASSNLIQLGDLSADLLSAVGPALLNSSSSPNSRAVDPEPAGLTELSCQLFRWARKDAQFRIIPAMERELIVHAMAETGGNQAQAARLLGITRATLRKRLVRFRIQREVLIR
jgi:DNA-binding NtrC family response regulator